MEKQPASPPPIYDGSVDQYMSAQTGHFLCSICLEVVSSPVQCKQCSELFCQACIHSWLRQQQICPRCRYHRPYYAPIDHVLRGILNELEIYCPNRSKGCQSIVLYGSVKAHLASECLFELVPCPNYQWGCPEKVPREEVQKHLKNYCGYTVKCTCGRKVIQEQGQHAECIRKMLEELKQVKRELEYNEKKLKNLEDKEKELIEYKQKLIEHHSLEKAEVSKPNPYKESELVTYKSKFIERHNPEKDEAPKVKPQKVEREKGPDGRVACAFCSRMFAVKRIEKHETICAKMANKKREGFNSKIQRIGDLVINDDFEDDVHNIPLNGIAAGMIVRISHP